MSPLAHANQSVLIQRVPQTQKNLFRPQANTKKPQENTRLSFAAKTAMTILSSLSASYILYQNLPSKMPAPPPPSSTINPMFWVIGTLTASALLFFSKMNKCLIKENDEEISVIEHQKTPRTTYKTIKERFKKNKKLTNDDFNEINKVIEYLKTNHQSQMDSDLALSLSYFIRWLILQSEPESHKMVVSLSHKAFDSFCQFNESCSLNIAEVYSKVFDKPEKNILTLACKEINDKILNSNNNNLKLKLAIFYAKIENPRPFRQIIRAAWDDFHKDPNLATEFLITCTQLKDKMCQSYLIIYGNLNFGQENNTNIALACAADMTLQGNKLCAFNACEKHLKEKQYDLFLPIAKKIIESSKKEKNIHDNQSFYQDIIKSFFNSEKGDDKTNMHRLIKILISVSIISKDKKTTELILNDFNLNDFDLTQLYKKNQDPETIELNIDEPQGHIKQISL